MVHLKTILDTRRKKSDGSYPIAFRVTNVKKVNLIPTGISIRESDWDSSNLKLKSTHPNCNIINLKLSKGYYELQKIIIQLEEGGQFDFETLKAKLNPDEPKVIIDLTFSTFANNIVTEFISVKRTGNALVYKTAINRLMDFVNNPKIEFRNIDYTLLDSFQRKLQQEGMSKNTIANYLRSIRAIYNKAIKAKIIGRDIYPFYDISIKSEKTAKRAIEIFELQKIYTYKTELFSPTWHAHNYFFLSFALIGISFTDMAYLNCYNIKNDYLKYRRRKTKKLYTIKLDSHAIEILNFYKGKH